MTKDLKYRELSSAELTSGSAALLLNQWVTTQPGPESLVWKLTADTTLTMSPLDGEEDDDECSHWKVKSSILIVSPTGPFRKWFCVCPLSYRCTRPSNPKLSYPQLVQKDVEMNSGCRVDVYLLVTGSKYLGQYTASVPVL